MKLITRHDLAKQAANRWSKQYPPDRWPDKQGILKKIINLGKSPSPDDVDKVIGNGSWTRITCTECRNENADSVIHLGEEPDYESMTVYICFDCLDKATSIKKAAV